MFRLGIILIFCSTALLQGGAAWADEAPLSDRNGDGEIEILAFGDSITYGVGDGFEPGEFVPAILQTGPAGGWPLRISSLLGHPVQNAGVPGEGFVVGDNSEPGIERFPDVVVGSSVDLVIIKEGANDARRGVTSGRFGTTLQKAINVARADGKGVALATLAPPTANRSDIATFTRAFSAEVRHRAAINEIPVVDIEGGFDLACPILFECPYYNLPEGLHPNSAGYDAMAQMFATELQ